MDFFATGHTSCLGSETNTALRTAPSAGNAFDPINPGSDPTNHGPVVAILGNGAQPNDGSDFRGFIALDIRNFQAAGTQLYYNGVTSSTGANTLKAMEANWVTIGGYPGPMFPVAISPPDPNDQVAAMSGNSTGIVIDEMIDRYSLGDEILIAVYPGSVMAIPDFTLSPPGTIALPITGLTANAGSIKVGKNQSFTGVVDLSTLADALDPQNPMVTGKLVGADPITYSPDPVTPSLGSGTTVTLSNMTTLNAVPGIYTLWIQGQAGSPYLTTKWTPAADQGRNGQSRFQHHLQLHDRGRARRRQHRHLRAQGEARGFRLQRHERQSVPRRPAPHRYWHGDVQSKQRHAGEWQRQPLDADHQHGNDVPGAAPDRRAGDRRQRRHARRSLT